MAVQLVKIVNANGRIALVPETYPPLVRGDVRRAPSQRAAETPVNLAPEDGGPEPVPARNASTDVWRDYATSNGLSSEEADAMSRDDLVAHFTSEED